jgi:hypothetical protein
MPTGRRDGRVSKASEVNLPGPTLSVADATKAFTAKGMTQADMVTLIGPPLTTMHISIHLTSVNDCLLMLNYEKLLY